MVKEEGRERERKVEGGIAGGRYEGIGKSAENSTLLFVYCFFFFYFSNERNLICISQEISFLFSKYVFFCLSLSER